MLYKYIIELNFFFLLSYICYKNKCCSRSIFLLYFFSVPFVSVTYRYHLMCTICILCNITVCGNRLGTVARETLCEASVNLADPLSQVVRSSVANVTLASYVINYPVPDVYSFFPHFTLATGRVSECLRRSETKDSSCREFLLRRTGVTRW